MQQDDLRRRTGVESVMRATRLLECFRRGEPSLPLKELVRRSGYSKTTTYRLLLTLEQAGWLERDEASAFRLTIRLFEIGSILVDSLDLRREGLIVMRGLSKQCGLAVHLVIPVGGRAVCIERVNHGHNLRIPDFDVGGSQPLHQGGAARALLAHNEAGLLPQLLRVGLEAGSFSPAGTLEQLVGYLADTRQRGYSLVDPGDAVGVAALGAPVFDRSKIAVAGLGVCGLREQILPHRPYLIERLKHAAADLSARLGHPHPIND